MTEDVRPLILVLEDEPMISLELELRLRHLGYRVAGPASDAERAISIAHAERPDLLLADVNLNGSSDGIQVAQRLRRELGIPAVYLSGYADGETLTRAMASDPFGYLTKPLRASDLHTTITTALHRDRLEKALAERERQLAASEARFRAVFDASPDALLVIDASGVLRLANQPAQRLFGYALAELEGLHVGQLFRADVLAPTSSHVVHGITRQGHEIPLEISLNRAPPESELGTVLTARDISERIQQDLEIQKLAAVVEHASECICLSTLDGRLIFLNEAGGRMLGIDPAHAESHLLEEVIPKAWEDTLHHELRPRLLTGQSWEGELQLLNLKTGRHSDVHCTSFPVTCPRLGLPAYFAYVALDITERKLSEEALARSREELQRGQKLESLGRLAGGVAHDFNNMLTVILGLSRLLGPLLSEQPHALSLVRDIHAAGSRSHELVQRLLAFARRQPVQAKAVEINGQIRDFSRLIARTLGPKVEFLLDVPESRFVVWIEPPQLEQMLLNLVVNARDAMPRGGRLWLRCFVAERPSDPSQSGYMIEVEDEGCGMSEEIQRRLFEPFFTTKDFGQGTGLGLSIVYGVVTEARGEIHVFSAPERGATFRIWLPAHHA